MGKKLGLVLVSILAIVIMLPTAAWAKTEPTYAITPEDQQVYECDFLLSVDDLEYTGSALLESIAVSTDGRYALCFSDIATHHINLYDQSCILVRHFTFSESGAISVSFDEEDGNMILFPFRKHVLIKIDNEGNYIGSLRDKEELDKVAKMDAINKFQVSRGGNVYSFCGKSIFSSDNQKFTVVDKSGKLLFEYVSPTNQQGIMLLLSRISFVVFCFLTTILICKRRK